MKERYLNIMDQAFCAYGEDHVREYYQNVRENGLREHGFPRLAANLVILIAHGRQTHLLSLAEEMFAFCCDAMPRVRRAGNDFSVKELVYALIEAEAAGIFPSALTERARASLKEFQPLVNYDCIAQAPDQVVGNWAAYNAASEYLRQVAGLCDATPHLSRQLPTQLRMFDENGMYRDPHEPMLYDLATRVQLAVLIHEGYRGEYREKILYHLKKAEDLTSKLQSVTGEIPFGGRSNQFLFNEAYSAALYEFYATSAAKDGDRRRAGEWKDAADLACSSIESALSFSPVRHIRNRYAQTSLYGCEGYGYFDKYMISLASFIYLAYRFADDTIKPFPCPARTGGFVARTSDAFHKLVANAGGYFLEFDLSADTHYDGNGLGRIHKAGVPSALCLSVSFPGDQPNYVLPTPDGFTAADAPMKNELPLALCAAQAEPGNLATSYEVVEAVADPQEATVILSPADHIWREEYHINADGVCIRVTSQNASPLFYHLPLLDFDGKEHSQISWDRTFASVTYRGASCEYRIIAGELADTGRVLSNRNGVYRHFLVHGTKEIQIQIKMG